MNKIIRVGRKICRSLTGNVLGVPIVFFHVPKCGGTSIRDAISNSYGIRLKRLIDKFRSLDAFCEGFSSRISTRSSKVVNENLHEHRKHLLAYMLEKTQRTPILRGHFRYSKDIHDRYEKSYIFVTVIRNPVDRFISHYLDGKRHSGEFGHDMSIKEYCDKSSKENEGSFIKRFFCDCNSEASTKTAIENIESIDIVGLLEYIDKFEIEFNKKLGVKLNIPHLNKGGSKKIIKSFKQNGYIGKIKEICQSDIEIYKHFEKKLTQAPNSK